MWDVLVELASGGELRASGPADARDVVLLAPGGTAHDRPGGWSSNMRWLAPRLRRRLGPQVRIVEVRYGNSSWNNDQLRGPIEDVREALEFIGTTRHIALVGFSMGGAATLANAGAAGVLGLVAIAPWLPGQLPVDVLDGKRLRVIFGTLDGELPLVPGIRDDSARAMFERARTRGIDATFDTVRGGLHGIALPLGPVLLPMPRAHAFTHRTLAAVQELFDPARSAASAL